ncbi:tigger transposable element-derived protein 1-like [Toxorhynchites rutilus septentrionalis]|uniref:tigger transposable element-derived protein 1-like n=1 Tax=Toxorhynchites rutilus septentrionalis TaxID=329112 RepID=UPI002479F782|nr:tigger transposable element-derived protein 1-like [Toxorhynchites rutilus septentrionalis]
MSQKRCPLDQGTIMAKALRLYGKFQEEEPSSFSEKKLEFSASKGWFYRFIRKHSIRNVQIKGESASADLKAAKSYPAEFKQLIEDGKYHPDQVFNADETGVFWKKMPSRTYVAKAEKSASGFKVAKDRITLLFCSNASGDRMLKPLLLHKSLRPRSMKCLNFNDLPVHWMSNAKAWVTQEIFRRWLEECFVPEGKPYLAKKGLEFRVLLVIDNAPGHLRVEHPNVQIVFLPPNTTSLIQPLDQGIIATFKRHYIKTTFRYILNEIDTESIEVAVKLLKRSTLNACWKPLWPDCVHSSMPASNEEGEILLLAHAVGGEGFDDFSTADIAKMLREPLFEDEDLLDYVNNSANIDHDEETEFTESKIKEAISFRNDLRHCLLRYTELVKYEKKTTENAQLNGEEPQPVDSPLKRRRCGAIYDSD